MSAISNYLLSVQTELSTGNALEHTYRPALKTLIESLDETINAVNEPARSAHGAPDFVFLNKSNKDLILGYAETKDLDVELDQIEKSEQLKRYLGYPNLILTNYLEFRFFRNGEKYQTIKIAEIKYGVVQSIEASFASLEHEIKAFISGKPETIKSAEKLAKIMGGKASRIREYVYRYITSEKNIKSEELFNLFEAMKKLLVHDLSHEQFSDMYAQTLVYGLFVARYYDKSPLNFSRSEARELVPASNPFLQKFFDHIGGTDFIKKLSYITDELCAVFSVSDIPTIMNRKYNLFGETVDKDPIIHFYEDFLEEYDPDLKRKMGAYYTPVPVVKFMVKAVDELLIKEFGLKDGLADTVKISHTISIQNTKRKVSIPRVQILDPAVGTATFLNEIIKYIYAKFTNQQGLWNSYVESELLPRLHGFELMMAPYTIAHLKLALTLRETKIESFDQRIGVYLTNTLEEGKVTNPDLFNQIGLVGAITTESVEANKIKNDTPIMVIIGNPPYSGISSNMTEYANSLVNKYKVEPGGKQKLQERKHWLNDDYVKFIAFAENLIEKNGDGIVAMITNHGYLDNPTFRGMRWHLTKTFNSIYVIDLHGNSKKKEVSPDGSPDKNVFDIQQGVSIIFGIKKNTKNSQAKVYRADLWGSRKVKFDKLLTSDLKDIEWKQVALDDKSYLFIENADSTLEKQYLTFVSLTDLFIINSTGIVTMGDGFVIDANKTNLLNRISRFLFDETISESNLKEEYGLGKNYAKWVIGNKGKSILGDENKVIPLAYRPFDTRYTYFDQKFIWRMRSKINKHILGHSNISLLASRMTKGKSYAHAFVTNNVSETIFLSPLTGTNAYNFPLYTYTDSTQNSYIDKKSSNLNQEYVALLLDKVSDKEIVTPENIFDYIYASLYSSVYRIKYKDFLKSDFPRIPPAKDSKSFWQLVKLGGQLRKLHLLDEKELGALTTTYPVSGTNEVEKLEYKDGKVYINSAQYFDGVSQEVFDFYIGGYQPAQKWLKDRKGQKLSYEDIRHYQQIIASQSSTLVVMKLIDKK